MIAIPQMLNISLRILFLILSLAIGLMVVLSGVQTAFAATLRPVTTLTGDQLTVGDVFSGLSEEKAAYVLGPAPAPGKDMVLDARTLMRIAIALDLPWRPSSTADMVTVRRDATVIDSRTLQAELTEAIKLDGLDGDFDLTFTGGAPMMALPPGMAKTVEIVGLNVDRARDTFRATIVAPSADNPQATLELAGAIQHIVEVPVLRDALRNGDIIGERDIEMLALHTTDIQQDMILDAETLIGMTPRRVLTPGKPVRGIDLETPELVSRGDSVTLIFNDSTLFLTAKGKALQNGGEGDLIRVVNISSSRTIEGIITGDRQVTVTP